MSFVRGAVLVVVAGVTFLLAAAAVFLVADLTRLRPPELPDGAIPVFVLLLLGLPATASFLVTRSLSRRWRQAAESPGRSRRWVGWAIVAGYVLTAIVGVPAVQSQQTAWAVSEYKRLKAQDSTHVWEVHPYVRTFVAIPIIPGVILSYHEYQLAGLDGFRGFDVSLWYLAGVTRVGELAFWLS